MKIIEALQAKDENLRISYGFRWLVGNGKNGWLAYEGLSGIDGLHGKVLAIYTRTELVKAKVEITTEKA